MVTQQTRKRRRPYDQGTEAFTRERFAQKILKTVGHRPCGMHGTLRSAHGPLGDHPGQFTETFTNKFVNPRMCRQGGQPAREGGQPALWGRATVQPLDHGGQHKSFGKGRSHHVRRDPSAQRFAQEVFADIGTATLIAQDIAERRQWLVQDIAVVPSEIHACPQDQYQAGVPTEQTARGTQEVGSHYRGHRGPHGSQGIGHSACTVRRAATRRVHEQLSGDQVLAPEAGADGFNERAGPIRGRIEAGQSLDDEGLLAFAHNTPTRGRATDVRHHQRHGRKVEAPIRR